MSKIYKFIGLGMVVVCAALTAAAQDQAPPPPGQQGARVARVGFVRGDASYLRGDAEANAWTSLGPNTPVMTGDAFYTPEGARVEVNLGMGNLARMDAVTSIDLTSLTRDVTQLGLNSGRLFLRVRGLPEGMVVEVDTPGAAATIQSPGSYFFSITPQNAVYAVYAGGLNVSVGGQEVAVNAEDAMQLEQGNYTFITLPDNDDFLQWSQERDVMRDHAGSARYVHPDVIGYEDLDGAGTWRTSAEYGNIWYPQGIGTGWAPYRTGRWMWQDPYGWSWVSYEPWGWAPYHYGRWVFAGNVWGWVPPPPIGFRGPRFLFGIEPFYAPALVGFFGGPGWGGGVEFGGPAIGWVPLAPSERYYYPWHHGPAVVNYVNINVINSVTVVNTNVFGTGIVQPLLVKPSLLTRPPLMGFAPMGIIPTPAGLLPFPGRVLPAVARPPAALRQNALVARLLPPPPPTSFSKKLPQIQSTGKPIASPVSYAGGVGKPFIMGAKAPLGTHVVSAFSTTSAGALHPKGKAATGSLPHPITQGTGVAMGAQHPNPALGSGRTTGGPTMSGKATGSQSMTGGRAGTQSVQGHPGGTSTQTTGAVQGTGHPGSQNLQGHPVKPGVTTTQTTGKATQGTAHPGSVNPQDHPAHPAGTSSGTTGKTQGTGHPGSVNPQGHPGTASSQTTGTVKGTGHPGSVNPQGHPGGASTQTTGQGQGTGHSGSTNPQGHPGNPAGQSSQGTGKTQGTVHPGAQNPQGHPLPPPPKPAEEKKKNNEPNK